MAQNSEREYIDGPLPIDESWWTAVLGDVEALEADIGSEEIPEGSIKLPNKENLASGRYSSVGSKSYLQEWFLILNWISNSSDSNSGVFAVNVPVAIPVVFIRNDNW